jgi:hypothetical protein
MIPNVAEKNILILEKEKKNNLIQSLRIVTGLTVYSSRESLYQETGWEKLSSRWERKKLCLMYNMYALSYLCDLLLPLVLILKVSNVLVFLVSLSRLFQRFMTDRMNEDWYNDKRHLVTV